MFLLMFIFYIIIIVTTGLKLSNEFFAWFTLATMMAMSIDMQLTTFNSKFKNGDKQ